LHVVERVKNPLWYPVYDHLVTAYAVTWDGIQVRRVVLQLSLCVTLVYSLKTT